jgi:autotransporter-associated beta strand protein
MHNGTAIGRQERRRQARLGQILALAAAAWTAPATAANLTWDANPTNPAAPNDGSGNWNTATDMNWSNGVSDTVWVNGETALIGNGGAAGTVTINDASGTVSAAGINFNAVGSGNYTIAASGPSTLTLTGGINFASGVSPTISAPIAGGAGLSVGGAGGTLNLSGNNVFTGPVAINSGSVVVAAGSNLGAISNEVALGTANVAPGAGDPVGTLAINSGANVTVNSFKSAGNNTAAANTISIGSGAALNVSSNAAMSGLSSSVNGVFVVGSPNVANAVTTSLTISGAGSLNVDGGSNSASFVAGMGNSNSSSFAGTVTLDMSGLAGFNFVTGAGAIPASGGSEFAVAHGAGSSATISLAAASSITAGTISVGDGTLTPGLAGGGPNAPAGVSALNLGSGSNTLNANTILLGNGRSRGNLQWASGVNTGTLTIAGAAGGASTADFIIGRCSTGTAANTASALNLGGHNVTVQAGTIQLGVLDGGSGSGANKGGTITFDAGTFNVANLKMAVGISGAATGNINGTFNLGNSPNSTGVLNVTNSFWIGDVTGGSARAQGSLVIKGGTANIGANIIDVSTAATSNSALTLSGGTLNMQGNAIGTTAAGTGGTRTIATITWPTATNSATLMNLGGNGINNAGLAMNGTGTLILTGTNTYSGGTTITSGILQVGQSSDAAPLANPLGAAAVVNSATLSFGSSQAVAVPNVISGAGTVTQVGTGTTTLNTNHTYTGPTAVAAGVLAVSNIVNGGANSSIGASSSAASNVLLTGGTLQYNGAGPANTDRLFSVSPNGGALDASGSGAIIFTNAGNVVAADPAARATTTSITSTRVPLPSVLDLSVGMTVSGANIPAGTTIASINRTTSSITLSNTPTIAGADTFNFSTTGRTLTLTGNNTGGNTIAGVLADSAGGGALSIAKSGAGTWNLGGANTYSGTTSVSGGTLVLQKNLTTTSGVAITGGTLQVAPAVTHVLKTPSLSITGDGRVDLKDNKLLTSKPIGTATAGVYDGVQGDVQHAYDFGSWDLPGLMTSMPDAGPTIGTTTIGVSDGASILFLGPTETGTFAGQTITGATTIAVYTYAGDVNFDGLVDASDYGIIDNYFQFPGTTGYANGDFNYDGIIDAGDYGIIDNTFQLQGSPIPMNGSGAVAGLSGVTAVPEPSACGFAFLAASTLVTRRRRRRASA